MKKTTVIVSILALALSFYITDAGAEYNKNLLDKVILTKKDIPIGFVYGKVPPFARKVLKNNPWMMDNKAIKRLTGKIYPGGDYSKISGMHMTIMANKRNPYGDDIVCYVIMYKNNHTAIDEIKKISKYADLNNDRAIVISRHNIAVYLHVDDIENFHHIKNIAENLRSKMQNI